PSGVPGALCNCVHLKWKVWKDNGGEPVTQLMLEQRAVGQKYWIKMDKVDGKVTSFFNKKVEEGKPYQF
ncbi:Hypothetical predicted protein, partial [Marmota monax]